MFEGGGVEGGKRFIKGSLIALRNLWTPSKSEGHILLAQHVKSALVILWIMELYINQLSIVILFLMSHKLVEGRRGGRMPKHRL